MRRILVDENVPVGLKSLLTGFEVRTADEMGWAGIANGRLLDAAGAAGFHVMITADRNIRAQQRLAGRKIALVVVSTNHWDTIRNNADPVISACGGGTYNVVQLPRPPPAVLSAIELRSRGAAEPAMSGGPTALGVPH